MGEDCKTLVCTVGLPRSGKTTWAKGQGHPIVNPDSIRLALHGQRFVVEAEPFVWAIAKTMVAALFLAGHSVVVLDATNTTKKRRGEWTDKRWQTYFRVFSATAEVCKSRAMAIGDQQIIPVIDRMDGQYEPLDSNELPW